MCQRHLHCSQAAAAPLVSALPHLPTQPLPITYPHPTHTLPAPAGIVELKIIEAKGLASADFTGKSDPYVIASIGDSSARTGTKFFTLDPKWNETVRLYVRSVEEGAVRLRVMDADLIGSDDDIGIAALPLSALAGGQRQALQLPVQDAGGGKGGGTLFVEAQFLPFSPLKAYAERAATAATQGGSVLGGIGAAILAAAAGAAAKAGDFVQAELRRRQWEEDLWSVPPGGSWTLLASDSRPASMPTDFEKARRGAAAPALRTGQRKGEWGGKERNGPWKHFLV